jgi:hypothetical protein
MTETRKQIAERYRAIRAEHPDMRARYAFSWAKREITDPPLALDWQDYNRGMDSGKTATLERDGFQVNVKALYDYDSEPDVTFSNEPDAAGSVEHPEWRAFMERTDGYGDDPNYGYRTPDVYRWITPNYVTVAENRDYYAQNGYSRNDANLKAQSDIRQIALDAISEDRNVFWIRVTVYREGVELGSDSLGGIDLGRFESDAKFERELSEAVEDNGMIDTAISEANETLSRLIETAV